MTDDIERAIRTAVVESNLYAGDGPPSGLEESFIAGLAAAVRLMREPAAAEPIEAPDFGEPWRMEWEHEFSSRPPDWLDRDGKSIHGRHALLERAFACVNAMAGIADPAAEIAALRAERGRLREASQAMLDQLDRLFDLCGDTDPVADIEPGDLVVANLRAALR